MGTNIKTAHSALKGADAKRLILFQLSVVLSNPIIDYETLVLPVRRVRIGGERFLGHFLNYFQKFVPTNKGWFYGKVYQQLRTCLQGIPFNTSTTRGLNIGRFVSLCPQQNDELSPQVNTCIMEKKMSKQKVYKFDMF